MGSGSGEFNGQRLNPGVQARLLAFQQRRQQLQQQGNSSSSNETTPTSNVTPTCTTPSSDIPSPQFRPHDDMPLRRTSFRLAQKEKSDDLAKRTSFRLSKPSSIDEHHQQHEQDAQQSSSNHSSPITPSNAVPSIHDSHSDLNRSNSYHKSTSPAHAYHINKSVEYITKVKTQQKSRPTSSSSNVFGSMESESATIAASLTPSIDISKVQNTAREGGQFLQSSPSSNSLSLNSTNTTITNVTDVHNANNHENNNNNSNSNKPKLSLSQRRGMKLDFNSLSPSTESKELDSPSPMNLNMDSNLEKLKSMSLGNIHQRMRNSPLPNRSNPIANNKRKPMMKMDLSNPNLKPSLPNLSNNQSKFASYSKYIDVKSGSLNFSGKASLHSKGVDFTNGSSFHISMDDLEFLEELGRGNYGVVSKVLHKPTGIIMAMKEVRLELDDSKFSQILMELQVLHSCKSDCIVDFYGAFFVEGAVYMCIEYMRGGSIDKVYGKGISEIPLAFITKRVIKGLKELKDDHNIIHRDVKPTNMLVNEKGEVKLCDFGVSGNLVASLARTNIGCQSYMAPERIKHANPDVSTYSVQSDIWSLGLSILEIAKGCYPYSPETFNNVFSQLSAIVDGEPPELPADKFSEEAKDFVAQCLNKNPKSRPTYAQLLNHKWLNIYSDHDGENAMAKIVAEKNASESEKDNRSPKAIPALHKGLGMPPNSL